uniref:Glycosyltransferase 61 catalytic domain-containing protein n=1 Tax=Neobodo designis TaxID=312471 RepID=A0A7S1KYC6_NEODS|mmetsp:Transcript_11101/g.34427  ORF Transcript_11101/g.34427 Transcript_11101/m.34427 type:complete len:522 (+) Transcript_11101:47-1612(+)|eukprot:CAMPEP_0174855194 /NCGR_PEP_ID=MMETSP1114-20130205/32682_1 /TAXON_ID=312471 /ORGANISM="Neobodo designis, Strain CCAP 1951/1" /LENGTH=521 /DNA_ID=CAMNT_0016089925 /DNA_START=47 /DNA_END=1612 /DNA_ORIENTATION=+
MGATPGYSRLFLVVTCAACIVLGMIGASTYRIDSATAPGGVHGGLRVSHRSVATETTAVALNPPSRHSSSSSPPPPAVMRARSEIDDSLAAAANFEREAARASFEGLIHVVRVAVKNSTRRNVTCSSRVLDKLEFAHRRPRPRELTTFGVYNQTKLAVSALWSVRTVEHAVLGPVPICLTPNVDLAKPFGAWGAFFINKTTKKRPSPLQLLPSEPPPHVAVVSPGVSASGYTITCEGVALTAGGCLWELSAPRPLPWQAAVPARIVVSLCDAWCKGYYHFTHEHLPRVALVHPLLVSGEAVLALPHRMNSFQQQFFEDILGIKRIEVGTVAGGVVLHPSPMRCGNTFSGTLHLFRRLVFSRLNITHRLSAQRGAKLRLLFAERSKGSRMATNYKAIKSHLMSRFQHKLDFNTTTGREHVMDQINLFARADIVLGPHGANLANSMFMRSGSHVVEMASMAKGNMCYYTTAVRVGLQYHFVPHMNGKDAAYVLAPELIERHIQEAIARISSAFDQNQQQQLSD